MILTREEALQKHREMWNWIADQTEAQKRIVKKVEYLEAHGIFECEVLNSCFLCEYTIKYENADSHCGECPVTWYTSTGAHVPCWFDYTLFDQWCHALTWQDVAQLARRIANL